MPNISVIIPIYNEEGNILMLFERLRAVVRELDKSYEFFFVNDGSKDASLAIVKDLSSKFPEVRYIDFARNFGHQVAVTAGLDHCSGNVAVIIDADLQDPPELISAMYAKWKEIGRAHV